MTPTKELRDKLDELGIEYVGIGGITNWGHAEFDELADGSDTRLIVYEATPEQAIAATVGAVPETKYLMALDEAREAQRKLEMCQTVQKVYQSKCRSLKETNADLRRIIGDMKAAEPCAGTLTAEQVRECLKGVYFEGYSDGATHRVNGIEETDWQAIADELNAVAGTGTCRNISKVTDARKRKVRFVCSECDAWIDSEFIWNHEYSNGESPWVKDCKLNYCPNCGRRIVEEEAE